MIIHDVIKSAGDRGRQTLTAIATFETPSPRSFRVFFDFENAPGDIISTADPFLIGFLIAAMLLGENLEIRGPVDPELLFTIRENIMPLLRAWFPCLHEIEVTCTRAESPSPRTAPAGAALAFSGGLDAMYTAVKNLEQLDWLVVSRGFDTRTYRQEYHEEFWLKTLTAVQAAADTLGPPLVVVTTNLREISHYQAILTRRGRIDPDYYTMGDYGPSGSYLAAIARCLVPACSRFTISASVTYDILFPYSSHPLLDPMWSTPGQQILHDGCEATRTDKIGFLKTHRPESLEKLRVCWRPGPGQVNCSHCEKCLRTMSELRNCGAEQLGKSFNWPVDLDAIRRLDLDAAHQLLWMQVRDRAIKRNDRDLARAVSAALNPFRRSRLRAVLHRENSRAQLARKYWKLTRRVMKPPNGESGEVPTPPELLRELKSRNEKGTGAG